MFVSQVVQGPYIGADGRVKHRRFIGEEIPEQPIEGSWLLLFIGLRVVKVVVPAGYKAGNHARVLSGPHLGLCGKVCV